MLEMLIATIAVAALIALLTIHESRVSAAPSSSEVGPWADRSSRQQADALPVVSRRARCTCGHSRECHPACSALCGCQRFEYAGGLLEPSIAERQLERVR